ncbi:hypothetical protein ACFSHT_16035 [Paraburkholderia silviterrae]|uniref:Uncharacterized protein n=1 Tax=Paraburkholderia silviterrae TaxID=2528715 RepID=A0A4R5MA58_9BURK|nr:hypothetical protein [Paraburkholderia silviterrae]TDG23200.1 hypothetical protein EYW47_14800 [Paraburkholderia silviterrae]
MASAHHNQIDALSGYTVYLYSGLEGQKMEPLWEYRWEFVEDGHWGGRKETLHHMTDEEATVWWAYGRKGTRRLDETKRDRNTFEVDWSLTNGYNPYRGLP